MTSVSPPDAAPTAGRRSRTRVFVGAGILLVVVVAIFVTFIAIRKDVLLVGALYAAAEVLAAGLTAVAAMAAMRSAAESSAAARRSREAVARAAQPSLSPAVVERDGRVWGTVRCSGSRAAVDVMVVWMPVDGGTITAQADRLNPDQPGDPAGGDPALIVDLHLAAVNEAASALKMVWLEYGDDTGTGRWQESWQPTDAGGGRVRFVRTYTRLTD